MNLLLVIIPQDLCHRKLHSGYNTEDVGIHGAVVRRISA